MAKTKPSSGDTFTSMLTALRALYDQEIARLVEVYRPRILAGEFSGDTAEGPKYLRLRDELLDAHPWLATERGQRIVIASCRWLFEDLEKVERNPASGEPLLGGPNGSDPQHAADLVAHDLLKAAAARGWVKRLRWANEDEPYALRVA